MRFSVATLAALLMVVSSPTTNVSARSVSSLVLVDVSDGIKDVMILQDDDVIDTTDLGTQLSVRAEMQGGGCLEFDLDDGATKRIETAAPHYLAGRTGENADYSYRLASNGLHTLKVCPSSCSFVGSQASRSAEAQQGCLTVRFETSDGSAGAFFPFPDVANYDVEAVKADTFGILSGELLKWHTTSIAFAGPPASELGNTEPGAYTAPSTFADYRLDCTFTHTDGTTYVVPGFYAGNGMVANDQTIGGNIWQCNFVPDRIGEWSYSTVYKHGTNVAQNGGGNPGGFFDGRAGSFTVADVDAETLSDKDFRSKGRLSIANGHWQFSEGGEYFLKIGPDSPQNVMAYADFDFTTQDIEQPYLKSFVTHEDDYVDGQTTWAGGKGTGLIGAINYLSGQGMNVMSLMTLNLDGDDGSIFPFVHANPIGEENNFLQYDISKLAQWDVVMSHAEKMGVALHIKLGGDASEDSVDGAPLNENMKLYLREMVARYGHHLAIVWDLGVDISVGYAERRSAEIKSLDPYQNPVAVSTTSATVQQALANIPNIDSVTLLSDPTESTYSVNSHVAAYSAVDGLAVQSVEVGTGVDTDGGDADHDTVRQESLWGALMAGSAGVQFYFGTSFLESDLTLQDFRSRANLWEQAGYALEFFNMIPFQDMTPQNDLVSEGSYCLADAAKQTIAIYKKKGASMPSVNLSGSSGSFEVLFYSPTEGGDLISGGSIMGGSLQPIPSTPESYDDDGDWAILVKSA